MKIIQNNKEYGYQQPIINDIDVVWDTNITASGQEHTLTSNLSSYARIIVSMTIPGIDGQASNNATGSVDLSYEDFRAGKEASYYYGTADQRIRVKCVSDTKVRVDASLVPVHVKIEGVKRTAQIGNLTSERLTVTVPSYVTESYITGELLGDWAHIHGGFKSTTTFINVGSTLCTVNGIKFDTTPLTATVSWCNSNDGRIAFIEAVNNSNTIRMRDVRAEANNFYWFDIVCKCVRT